MICRAEFDRLTEYSSLLLQHGDNDIYSTTPEEMAVQLEADEAAELQAVMGILSTAEQPIIDQAVAEELAAGQQAPVDPDEDIFGSTEPQPQPAMVVTDPAGTQSSAGQHTDQQVTSDASSSAVQVGVPSADSSFTFDQDSGTWFNADMGYYYDAAQGLYGDAASGHWYSYRDGAYQLVY